MSGNGEKGDGTEVETTANLNVSGRAILKL